MCSSISSIRQEYQTIGQSWRFERFLFYDIPDISFSVNFFFFLLAGFDSRSVRFHSVLREHQVSVFELDLPDFSAMKKGSMLQHFPSIASTVHYLPIDFAKQSLPGVLNLSSCGFRDDVCTLWIWEGVIHYLPTEAVNNTLSFIASHSSPGSLLIFDYHFAAVPQHPERYYCAREALDYAHKYHEPFLFWHDPSQLDSFVSRFGFKVVRHVRTDCQDDLIKLVQDKQWLRENKPYDWVGFVVLQLEQKGIQ